MYAHPELVAEQRRIFTAERARRRARFIVRAEDVILACVVAAVAFHWVIFH